MRATGTPAHHKVSHKALIREGGRHEAEVTPRSCEAPTRHQGVPHVTAARVLMLPRQRQEEGGAQRLGKVGQGTAP